MMAVAPTPTPHALVRASGLLIGTVAFAMLAGALLGWLLGGWDYGLLAGAIAGIPLGVGAVYAVFGRSQDTP